MWEFRENTHGGSRLFNPARRHLFTSFRVVRSKVATLLLYTLACGCLQ
jgi:hypothetical protein